jgi:hypothetical protein
VPEAILDRLRRAEASGRAATEGLDIASELAAAIRPHVQGIQVSASSGAVQTALSVVEALSA